MFTKCWLPSTGEFAQYLAQFRGGMGWDYFRAKKALKPYAVNVAHYIRITEQSLMPATKASRFHGHPAASVVLNMILWPVQSYKLLNFFSQQTQKMNLYGSREG